MFALGLVGYAVVEVLTRAFYAMHDTKTPVIAGVAVIGLNILLSALLVGRFGHTALALSLSADDERGSGRPLDDSASAGSAPTLGWAPAG